MLRRETSKSGLPKIACARARITQADLQPSQQLPPMRSSPKILGGRMLRQRALHPHSCGLCRPHFASWWRCRCTLQHFQYTAPCWARPAAFQHRSGASLCHHLSHWPRQCQRDRDRTIAQQQGPRHSFRLRSRQKQRNWLCPRRSMKWTQFAQVQARGTRSTKVRLLSELQLAHSLPPLPQNRLCHVYRATRSKKHMKVALIPRAPR